jgi:hypothetical protein
MSATSREIVHQTLAFAKPSRVPQDIWVLPIATLTHPQEAAAILRDFPPDIASVPGHERTPLPTRGNMFALGEYVDEWGCTFYNIQRGVIGEVKDPLVKDWATDRDRIHLPREWLTLDRDAVNRDCAATDQFVHAGFWPRPFEQLQFLRGSEELYMDLADPPAEMLDILRDMHALYCETLLLWAKTDVDALRLMDDWGSQRNLLISPKLWRELFKPMYRDYAQIAHSHGKKLFMHSDGYITAIYPDLIEIGLDAINSQIFCMGPETLSAFAGKITFWGEMDRQHRLPSGTPADIEQAVDEVHRHLWRNGGCIAHCEFGPGARPENVRAVYTSWKKYAHPQPSPDR